MNNQNQVPTNVKSIEATLQSLENENTQLINQVKSLQTSTETNASEIASLKAQILSNMKTIDSLKTQIANQNTEIKTLQESHQNQHQLASGLGGFAVASAGLLMLGAAFFGVKHYNSAKSGKIAMTNKIRDLKDEKNSLEIKRGNENLGVALDTSLTPEKKSEKLAQIAEKYDTRRDILDKAIKDIETKLESKR